MPLRMTILRCLIRWTTSSLTKRTQGVFPLSDDRPRMATPVVTWSITGACFLVFLWQSSLGAKAGEIALYHYGMIPARLFGLAKLRSNVAIPASATVLTSMFLHGGWLHLGL